jgi:pimeloyl-ACP methyl ester carboxylesterase
VPGCGGDEKLDHEGIREFVMEFGRRVITFDHPNNPRLRAREHEIWGEVTSKGLEIKAHNVLDIIKEVIQTMKLEKVDVVAHSEGAPNAINAATHDPLLPVS